MTMTTHERPLSAAGDAYLTAVGAALAGVPDSDRLELLDDLSEHLGELAHESDAGLIARLGPPEQYAAELIASAGIETAANSGGRRHELVERLRAKAAQFETPAIQKLRAFALELRPGWWVARGWLVVAALAARSGLQEALWLPNVTSNGFENFVLLAGAIAVSVWAGRGPKWTAWIATAIGIVALISVTTADRSVFYQVYDDGYTSSPGVLIDPQGQPITNVFPYDASGKPIRAFLFTQDGNPLDVGNGGAFQENGIAFTSGLFPQPVLTFSEITGRGTAEQPTPPRVAVPQLPPTTAATTAAPTPTTRRPNSS
jgi:hypothetical protein